MAKGTLRVALVGQGFMGRAHSNAYRQVGHFFDIPFDLDCRVLCGRDRARLEPMAARWGWQETETDWRAVVERKDIDAVDVAVPNHLHAEVAIAAAGAGKIVLCEKPLAVSAEEGARMAEAARAVPNMVWYNYRRAPAIAFSRRLVEQGRLGRVFHYRATYLQGWGTDASRISWKLEKQYAGSGVLGDLLSHLVDTAMHLNGAIREVCALQQTFAPGRDIDDATLLLARFDNGSVGSFEATRYAVGCRNRNAFEIHGEGGMLRFNLEDLNRLEFFDAGDDPSVQGARNLLVTEASHPYAPNFWKPGHIIGYEHTFIATLADFLAALGAGERFRPDFEDAQRVQLVLDAAAKAAERKTWEWVGGGATS